MASNKQDKQRLRSIALAERTARNHYFVSVYGTGDLVQPFDMRGKPCGINMPPVARSQHRKVAQKLAASTQRIISLAKAGMSSEEIAREVGSTAHKISNMLSYHRTKGEDLPIRTLPLDEYEALHRQGLSQHRIAQELGIGKMKASSCARSLIAQGRIEGNNRREKCNDSPIGGDKWALVLGRKSLY